MVIMDTSNDWLCVPCLDKRVGAYADQAGEEVVTLRDRFAIAAMPLYIPGGPIGMATLPEYAQKCYLLADAMMKARKENG
jgi:hypothetical protein